MRTLVYSDVHGNLPAFEEMLKDAGPCEAHICLGDLVNYGPWSNECVDLAVSLKSCVNIMGNHEEAFIAGNYPGSNLLVKTFFEVCIVNFTRYDAIRQLRKNYSEHDYLFCHTINDRRIYPDTDLDLESNCVIGHSHHQFVYRNNGYTLYNPGSVGQNRNFINVIDYMIYDHSTRSFEFRSLKYDVGKFIRELWSRGFPPACIEYYSTKKTL